MPYHRNLLGSGLLAVSLLGLAGLPASAQDDFYAGRTITIQVGVAAGGIYDISARLVAQHLGRFIPGNPHLIVENLPGGGGLLLANRIYNMTEGDDGTVIGLVQRSVPLLPLQGVEEAQFDSMQYSWIGSLSAYQDDAYLLLINASHPAQSAQDLIEGGESATFGTGNVGSSSMMFTSLAREVLGLDIESVSGYQGAAPIFLAMEQGEVDGQTIDLSAVLAQQRTRWEEGAFRPLVQFGRVERREDLADVPTARELAPDEEALAIIDFAEIPFFMSTPFVASPRLPEERRELLETAFMEMANDPQFLEEARSIGLQINPIDGAAILELIERAAQTPPEVIERYNDIVQIGN